MLLPHTVTNPAIRIAKPARCGRLHSLPSRQSRVQDRRSARPPSPLQCWRSDPVFDSLRNQVQHDAPTLKVVLGVMLTGKVSSSQLLLEHLVEILERTVARLGLCQSMKTKRLVANYQRETYQTKINPRCSNQKRAAPDESVLHG